MNLIFSDNIFHTPHAIVSPIIIFILILHDLFQLDPDLGLFVSPEYILFEFAFHFNVDHFQGTPDHSTEHVRVPQILVLWGQDYKVSQGILV